jgi:ribosomal protein L34E
MNLKAKIQAAASRAANGPGDPTSKSTYKAPASSNTGKYTKTIGPNPVKQKYESASYPKMKSTITEVSKVKKAPMSSMPTLRPTSVSNPNRPVARPYGEMTASKVKKRG